MDKHLKSYIDKYDRWLKEKTISHSSRVIPIKESIEEVQQVIPSEQALDILKKAELITLAECDCRKRYKRCDKPLEVCFILDDAGQKWIQKKLSRKIDIQTAEKILEQANKSGLVHMTLYQPDHKVFALCSCCSCCCHDLQLVLDHGKSYIMLKSDFIAEDDIELCQSCGECVERCEFRARSFKDHTLLYNADLCTGCGLCMTTCDFGAIRMTPRQQK